MRQPIVDRLGRRVARRRMGLTDLTGEELWGMSQLGYVPLKLLISTSVYSLGAIGGIKAAFQSFVKGEIPDLTTLIYDAREQVFDRLKREDDLAILLVEQHARIALEFAEKVIVLDRGCTVYEGASRALLDAPEQLAGLMGVTRHGERSAARRGPTA